MPFIQKHMRTIIGLAAGALGGYLYYFFIGCASGSCAITSNPVISTLYGAMAGALLFGRYQSTHAQPGNPGNEDEQRSIQSKKP